MPTTQSWFIYYKVPRASEAAITAQARSVLRAAARGLPAPARLMKKLAEADREVDHVTLMEIYDGVADIAQFRAALSAALTDAGVSDELIASRRIEVFTAVE
jgi:hypothetical protein